MIISRKNFFQRSGKNFEPAPKQINGMLVKLSDYISIVKTGKLLRSNLNRIEIVVLSPD